MDCQQKLLLGESRLFVPATNLHLPYFFTIIQTNRRLAESKGKYIDQTRKLVFCLHNVYSLAVVPSSPGKLQAGKQRTDSGQWPLALRKRSASFFIKISLEFFLSKPSCDSQPARDHASPLGKAALDRKKIPKKSLHFMILKNQNPQHLKE